MDDFSKIMEDAIQISNMIEGFSPAKTNSGSNLLFSNISNIINLMDIMKSFQNIGKPAPSATAACT